jgi:hypothetical protein
MQIQSVPKSFGKSIIAESANLHADEIIENGDVVQSLIECKRIREFIDTLEERLKPAVINATPDGGLQVKGARITVSQKKEYDYSHDTKWLALKSEEAKLAQERKAREKMLLNLNAPMADTETGEIIEPAKLVSVKSIVAVTLPK